MAIPQAVMPESAEQNCNMQICATKVPNNCWEAGWENMKTTVLGRYRSSKTPKLQELKAMMDQMQCHPLPTEPLPPNSSPCSQISLQTLFLPVSLCVLATTLYLRVIGKIIHTHHSELTVKFLCTSIHIPFSSCCLHECSVWDRGLHTYP